MKIVIAPDSFKDSLSAQAVADAIASGLAEVWPHAELIKCPMADGGEGTIEALLAACNGELMSASVSGPLGALVNAQWGWLAESRTAIIEMAMASGLQLLTLAQRDACVTSTEGTGQLISAALDAGARRVILAIGGSATNDGGSGMLSALGARFLDADDQTLAPGGLALADLARIDLSGFDPRLSDVCVEIAADVDNPLCGPNGASSIFGPQKGASPEQVMALDAALGCFADHTAQVLGQDLRDSPGSGAAGGMGFAAKAYLKASFRAGVEVVADLTGLEHALIGADLVITGEGRFDAQTLRGKTPLGVARVARRRQVPVIVLAGTLGEGYQQLYAQGIGAAFALVSGPMSLEQACRDTRRLLHERARDVARLWQMASGR
ncbi:glycerate kinase [Pseudomonas syringae]|uniref:glycerate kinase n=1 Tax=Pseudomonas syringae group TaxID=136849 RepID=UPI0016594133|nr:MULTISPECIES: glycerate kinase [Pseudomonas syringae group]MBC9745164.1 glycerate kinase [Pseudomonas syringae pv. syringae]MBC9749472.1 glycerate kinase [Pseudomonas syringae pv. syringae]MCK9718570.1 glycerate kinase [Pseudomonas syringae pv. syringae]MCK9724365.1 glycerate kinase [Pseudomonas syringae pv. syringae]MCK9763620.1 glycerate kinase [Pseudomonas syringae pv. syringae]